MSEVPLREPAVVPTTEVVMRVKAPATPETVGAQVVPAPVLGPAVPIRCGQRQLLIAICALLRHR